MQLETRKNCSALEEKHLMWNKGNIKYLMDETDWFVYRSCVCMNFQFTFHPIYLL